MLWATAGAVHWIRSTGFEPRRPSSDPVVEYVAERHALYSAIIDTRDRDLALIAQHNTSSPTQAALASPRPAP
jgi:hypothetical protein